MTPMQPSDEVHFARLAASYKNVGDHTWLLSDFEPDRLEVSRNLFEQASLQERRPRPRQLEVFALLSGISFEDAFTRKLGLLQAEISAVLGDRLHYWVCSPNLGLEYCVFKWPAESWQAGWLETVKDVLHNLHAQEFRFEIRGLQVNPDGCVVAKGFDHGAALFGIRQLMKDRVSFLPPKQSAWAHVPLGRILEPLGPGRFAELCRLIASLAERPVAATTIQSLKLVHETRWYMEEKTILGVFPLSSAAERAAP